MTRQCFLCGAAGLLVGAVTADAADPKEPLVDLRPRFGEWGLETRAQGRRGTCSVFAIVGALEYAHAAKDGRGATLSVEFLNWAAHKAVNRTADGGFFSDMWKGYQRYGIFQESELPYRRRYDKDLAPPDEVLQLAAAHRNPSLQLSWIKEWNVKTGLTDSQIIAIRETLAAGWPVCGGMRWPRRAEWIESILQMRTPEEVYDGHSVLLVGYADDSAIPGGGSFLIRNSAGPSRDGRLPYAYVKAYLNDAAWIAPTGTVIPAVRL